MMGEWKHISHRFFFFFLFKSVSLRLGNKTYKYRDCFLRDINKHKWFISPESTACVPIINHNCITNPLITIGKEHTFKWWRPMTNKPRAWPRNIFSTNTQHALWRALALAKNAPQAFLSIFLLKQAIIVLMTTKEIHKAQLHFQMHSNQRCFHFIETT